MRRFYSPGTGPSGTVIVLSKEESRHLRDVLRLNVGDEVSVFDGLGGECTAKVFECSKKSASLIIEEAVEPTSQESPLALTVAATIIPGDKYDLIVQKSVELGVATLVPLVTIRCEVKLADAQKRLERWRRIALEATKQCGRARLMQVAEPQQFNDAISGRANEAILFSERDGTNFSTLSNASGNLAVFYGPKGGWDDSELNLARESGIKIITLGGRILRAETAAIGITAILQHRLGDMN